MFILTIGDWSDDGHKIKEEYKFHLLNGTTLESLRGVHFKAVDKHGSVENYLLENPARQENLINKHFPNLLSSEELEDCPGEALALGWMSLLMEEDNSVKLEYEPDNYERFHFYGYDKHGRHIEGVGYKELY